MEFIRFLKPKNKLEEGGRKAAPVQIDEGEPEEKCPNCHKSIPVSRLTADNLVCKCGHHFRMSARQRIHMLADEGSFRELFADIQTKNPLDFPGYSEKIKMARLTSRENEGVLCGTAALNGLPCALFVMESRFMMGSMGSAVGEKITSLFEYATAHRFPVLGFTVSGGARMQEGLVSLMQMAKVSAAVKRHSDAGLLYLAVLTDPTTGGVTASFAMEADIIMAEPGATVGFAGARVIRQTTRKTLPKGFQTAEFVLQHGFIDCLCPRHGQKEFIAELLKMHDGRRRG